MNRRIRSAVALLACGAGLATTASCGVPTGDDTFTAIPPAEVPFGLAATSTTTTTTTTTTTVPLAPDTTTVATSTTTPIRLEPVEIYFLTRGRLQATPRELPPGFAADQVADLLEEGPPGDLPLDTLVEEGLIVSSTEARGELTVDLDADTFARIPSTQQTEAIAQIVMTMISSLRRVGLITFTIDDEPIAVKKGNSLLSGIGEPLSYEDYAVLLVNPALTTGTDDTAADEPPDSTEGSDSTTTTPEPSG
jgi:hypothetical protein